MSSLKDKFKSFLKRSGSKIKSRPTSMAQQPLQKDVPQPASEPATTAATKAAEAPVPAAESAPVAPIAEPHIKAAVIPHKDVNSNVSAVTLGTLIVLLKNDTNSSNVFAYITGQAIDNNNAVFLLSSDARTPYFPASPSTTGASLSQNVSIPMGAPGNTVPATIPRLAGGRIWFSIGAPLTFTLNPGPGLVEPSVFNPADPNAKVNFGFMEFTFNQSQVFANVSYVDFVGPPVSLTITEISGKSMHVGGLPANGLDTIAQGLQAQTAKDGQPWSSLIVKNGDQTLRIFSPNSGLLLNGSYFQNYWSSYIDRIWQQYTNQDLTINTQAGFGNVTGRVNAQGLLDFGNGVTFAKPSAADIFSCSTGPFATGSDALKNVIIPRLSAGINRSTMLRFPQQPNGANASAYYPATFDTVNHYARIVHGATVDGVGYAFPYDDVTPDGGKPQEGALSSGAPASMTVTIGGVHAYAG